MKLFLKYSPFGMSLTTLDEDMTHRVLMFSIPGSCQGRSPLEGYMKPARPNTPTWSRRQKLFVNPNWLHI
jgi:hypothetical protein